MNHLQNWGSENQKYFFEENFFLRCRNRRRRPHKKRKSGNKWWGRTRTTGLFCFLKHRPDHQPLPSPLSASISIVTISKPAAQCECSSSPRHSHLLLLANIPWCRADLLGKNNFNAYVLQALFENKTRFKSNHTLPLVTGTSSFLSFNKLSWAEEKRRDREAHSVFGQYGRAPHLSTPFKKEMLCCLPSFLSSFCLLHNIIT